MESELSSRSRFTWTLLKINKHRVDVTVRLVLLFVGKQQRGALQNCYRRDRTEEFIINDQTRERASLVPDTVKVTDVGYVTDEVSLIPVSTTCACTVQFFSRVTWYAVVHMYIETYVRRQSDIERAWRKFDRDFRSRYIDISISLQTEKMHQCWPVHLFPVHASLILYFWSMSKSSYFQEKQDTNLWTNEWGFLHNVWQFWLAPVESLWEVPICTVEQSCIENNFVL